MARGEVIYTACYSYRKRSVVVVACVLMLIFLPLFLGFLVSAFATEEGWSTRLGSLLLAAFVGMFGVLGVWLLRAWQTRKTLELEVSTWGVRYGGRDFPWDVVRGLKLSRSQKADQLTLSRRGFTADVNLITDAGISAHEYQALMSTLDSAVAPLHNHLRFT